MRARRLVVLLVLAVAAYTALVGYRGVYLLGQDRVSLKLLGAAVLMLPLIAVWLVVAELRFGLAMERLAGQDTGTGDSPLPPTAGGRIVRSAADERFARRRAEVEAHPGDWHRWFHLALAYHDAGDRRRARVAMHTAIDIEARERSS